MSNNNPVSEFVRLANKVNSNRNSDAYQSFELLEKGTLKQAVDSSSEFFSDWQFIVDGKFNEECFCRCLIAYLNHYKDNRKTTISFVRKTDCIFEISSDGDAKVHQYFLNQGNCIFPSFTRLTYLVHLVSRNIAYKGKIVVGVITDAKIFVDMIDVRKASNKNFDVFAYEWFDSSALELIDLDSLSMGQVEVSTIPHLNFVSKDKSDDKIEVPNMLIMPAFEKYLLYVPTSNIKGFKAINLWISSKKYVVLDKSIIKKILGDLGSYKKLFDKKVFDFSLLLFMTYIFYVDISDQKKFKQDIIQLLTEHN